MGVFKRPDSRFFHLYLEGLPGEKGIKEPTRILCSERNRPLAQKLYETRMADLARIRSEEGERKTAGRRLSSRSTWCYIYFLKSSAGIKIGRARDLIKRLQVLQVGTHEDLELLLVIQGPASLEKDLHHRFRALRFKREWFKAEGELLDFIDRAKHSGVDAAEVLFKMRPGVRV